MAAGASTSPAPHSCTTRLGLVLLPELLHWVSPNTSTSHHQTAHPTTKLHPAAPIGNYFSVSRNKGSIPDTWRALEGRINPSRSLAIRVSAGKEELLNVWTGNKNRSGDYELPLSSAPYSPGRTLLFSAHSLSFYNWTCVAKQWGDQLLASGSSAVPGTTQRGPDLHPYHCKGRKGELSSPVFYKGINKLLPETAKFVSVLLGEPHFLTFLWHLLPFNRQEV